MGDFEWTQHPEAEALIVELIDQAKALSPRLSELDQALRERTSTQLLNWLDHLIAPVPVDRLASLGFVDGFQTRPGVWRHPGAQLPAVVPNERYGVALRVDDVAAFAHAQGSTARIQGSPLAGLRRVLVSGDDSVAIIGVERRSWARGIDPETRTDAGLLASFQAWQLWDERPRPNTVQPSAVEEVIPIAQRMVRLVGSDLAASYVLEIERNYWQSRNMAGTIQHGRQDKLGLGWGNNDHHTFRSSRTTFMALVKMFNALGFVSRERFYAGAQAGWGAQVLEHPGCGGVLFTDVDLDPDEFDIDFSTAPLGESDKLGTVGMWCALHGESILSSGMHHLEGQFEFDDLRDDLSESGIGQMKPFSDFPHLRQAFTQAEMWPVSEQRLEALIRAGHITEEKAAEFAENGAAGSHLENLQRREGFKGFNQHSVSATMKVTDPRVYQES